MIKFFKKSSQRAQREFRANIREEIKNLKVEVKNIKDRSEKDWSIFDICELGIVPYRS